MMRSTLRETGFMQDRWLEGADCNAGGGTVTFGAPMVVYSERPASMYSQLQVMLHLLNVCSLVGPHMSTVNQFYLCHSVPVHAFCAG